MAVKQFADFQEHEAHVIGFALRTQPQIRLEQNLVAAAEVLQIDGCHRAVRNGQQCSILGANARRSQSDIFNNPGAVTETADVANPKYLISQYEDPPKQILD